jgi:hypothetical protein
MKNKSHLKICFTQYWSWRLTPVILAEIKRIGFKASLGGKKFMRPQSQPIAGHSWLIPVIPATVGNINRRIRVQAKSKTLS